MDTRIDVITLGVEDLERSLAFYRDGLGLPTTGVIGTEFAGDDENAAGRVVMFQLNGGLIFALYTRTELAKDANVPVAGDTTGGFSLGHAVPSRADVDALLERAVAAGATSTGPAHDRPWGIYSGYFRDPDGHLWEIIWNPGSTSARADLVDARARSCYGGLTSGHSVWSPAASCRRSRDTTKTA